MNRIAITAECVCDLPEKMRQQYGIDCIYFDIITDEGVFRDTVEISARNVLEYMNNGRKKILSHEPTVEQFQEFFTEHLKTCNEVVHISIGDKISKAYPNAVLARERMGADAERIHIIDSRQVTTGIGFLLIKAAQMRAEGKNAQEIVEGVLQEIEKISVSFITRDANYLYYNGRASRWVMNLCKKMALHPVLYVKDGELVLKTIMIGNYEKACKRYVKKQLKRKSRIDRERCFVTYADCSQKQLKQIETVVRECIDFEHLIFNTASATVSCNCGPNAFGVLYVRS